MPEDVDCADVPYSIPIGSLRRPAQVASTQLASGDIDDIAVLRLLHSSKFKLNQIRRRDCECSKQSTGGSGGVTTTERETLGFGSFFYIAAGCHHTKGSCVSSERLACNFPIVDQVDHQHSPMKDAEEANRGMSK